MQVVLPDHSNADRDIVVFLDEAQAAPTSEEAQERAAVAALARVAGHRNMQRVLPQAFQAAWAWCVQQVWHLLAPTSPNECLTLLPLLEGVVHARRYILDAEHTCASS